MVHIRFITRLKCARQTPKWQTMSAHLYTSYVSLSRLVSEHPASEGAKKLYQDTTGYNVNLVSKL